MLYKVSQFAAKHQNKMHKRHRGIVVDNQDPNKLGRVRVSIPGIYNESDKDKLPWIYALTPHGDAGNEKQATVNVPRMGSALSITFTNGSAYHGLYDSALVSENNIANEPFKDGYPDIRGSVDRNGNVTTYNAKDGSYSYKHYGVPDDQNSDKLDEGDSGSNASTSSSFAISQHGLKATQPSDGNSEDQGAQPKMTHGIDDKGSITTTTVKDHTTSAGGDTSHSTTGKTEITSGQNVSLASTLADIVHNAAKDIQHTAGGQIMHEAATEILHKAEKIFLN